MSLKQLDVAGFVGNQCSEFLTFTTVSEGTTPVRPFARRTFADSHRHAGMLHSMLELLHKTEAQTLE